MWLWSKCSCDFLFLKIFRFKHWKIWKVAAWNSINFGTLWAIRSNTTVLVCRRSFMSYYVKGFCVFPSPSAAQKILKTAWHENLVIWLSERLQIVQLKNPCYQAATPDVNSCIPIIRDQLQVQNALVPLCIGVEGVPKSLWIIEWDESSRRFFD